MPAARVVACLAALALAADASGQEKPEAQAEKQPSLDDTIAAGEADADDIPRRKFVNWNEYEGPLFTIRLGGGLLYESGVYSQNETSEQQFKLVPEARVRDFRVLLKGTFPKFPRLTWSAGIMYDGFVNAWLIRETGIMIDLPELWGSVFVGRTKEGFSLNKVMTGYAGWTMERAPISDATIPILADGVKWLGYVPDLHFAWNAGIYADVFSEGQTFSTYAHQIVARVAYLPLVSEESGTLLHLGASFRYGKPLNNQLRLRSRPEAFLAPYFLDTGFFFSNQTLAEEVEVYFRPGSWLFGTEYFVMQANSPEAGDPVFHGGNVVATWIVTGETRAYNTRGAFFKQVSPDRPVLAGGPGAWEVVAQITYTDLDAGRLQGGRFWRFTPMINWYLSDHVRLEFAYGYGVLDRFGLKGETFFFQNRIQLQL